MACSPPLKFQPFTASHSAAKVGSGVVTNRVIVLKLPSEALPARRHKNVTSTRSAKGRRE